MRSGNALSLVTRSCRESLPIWSSSVCGSRRPRPRTPTVIDGRVAGPSDSGGEPSHTVQLFRHKLDAELGKQSSGMCLPDPSMPLTDCVFLWSDGCCRHGFAPQVFELLSELALEFSSLVVNQPSRYAKKSDPVFDLRMLAGNHGNNTKSACEVKNVNEAQLVAFSARTNRSMAAVSLCLCEVSLASGVQDAAVSRTHRIAAEVLRELQLRCHQTRMALASAWFEGCPKFVCIWRRLAINLRSSSVVRSSSG